MCSVLENQVRGCLLEAEHIAFCYDNGPRVFDDVCLLLYPGDICTILGPNGAGKSTLLSCLAGHLTPKKGRVTIDGQDIAYFTANSLALKMGYMAQIQVQVAGFSVRDYLAFGCAPHLGLCRTPGRPEYDRVEKVMERMRIVHLANKSILQISGGELQQVRIARVLVQEPGVILMDEPTNHLDYGNQIKVLQMIAQLAREESIAIVLTTHVPDHAILLDGNTGVLDHSGVFVTGRTAEIVTQANLSRIYNTELCVTYVPQAARTVCMTYGIKCG